MTPQNQEKWFFGNMMLDHITNKWVEQSIYQEKVTPITNSWIEFMIIVYFFKVFFKSLIYCLDIFVSKIFNKNDVTKMSWWSQDDQIFKKHLENIRMKVTRWNYCFEKFWLLQVLWAFVGANLRGNEK